MTDVKIYQAVPGQQLIGLHIYWSRSPCEGSLQIQISHWKCLDPPDGAGDLFLRETFLRGSSISRWRMLGVKCLVENKAQRRSRQMERRDGEEPETGRAERS